MHGFAKGLLFMMASAAITFGARADTVLQPLDRAGANPVLQLEGRLGGPARVRDWLDVRVSLEDRLAGQDEAVIEAILGEMTEAEQFAREQALAATYRQRYEGRPGAAALQRRFASATSIQLRWLHRNRPLQTELPELAGSAVAAIDLVLGRQVARYARAVAAGESAEQIAVLTELQTGLLVLSAHQAALFAERLGEILNDESALLFDAVADDALRQAALTAVLNPALLVFDTVKHRGPNTLYLWLLSHLSRFEGSPYLPERLYLFDGISGTLVGFGHPRDIADHLVELLDPANIGWGQCSLGQMAAAGLRTGNFGCALGPQCQADASAEKPGRSTVIGGMPIRTRAGGASVLEARRGRSGSGASPLSPFGLPAADLQGSCQLGAAGAPTGGGGAGQPPPRGPSGFNGCLANAAFHDAAARSPAQCFIDAALRLNDLRHREVTVISQGPGGIPVVRGIYGTGQCEGDPLAEGSEVDRETWKENFEESTERAKAIIEELADALASIDPDYPTRPLGNSAAANFMNFLMETLGHTDLTQADYQGLADGVRQNTSFCSSGSRDCASKIREAEAAGGAFMGVTECGNLTGECNIIYTINLDQHVDPDGGCGASCQEELRRTLMHEVAAHGVLKYGKTISELRDLPTMDEQHDSYYDALGEIFGHEVDRDHYIPVDPWSAPRQCGPIADAHRDMLQCFAGGVAGIDRSGNPIPAPDVDASPAGPGLGNTSGNTDPTMDQWLADQYGDNALAHCTREQGFVAVGRDGQVYQVGGVLERREAAACGALDCLPPARPRRVNGICTCTVSDSGAALIQNAIARQNLLRTCAVMTPDCSRNPNSPCCGGGATPPPDLDPPRPVDPDVFDPPGPVPGPRLP